MVIALSQTKNIFLLAFFCLISALLEMLSIAAKAFLAVEGNINIIDDNFFNIFYLFHYLL